MSPEATEPALEILARNLDISDKCKELLGEAQQNDIIAFKVFTPDFQMSNQHVIGLVDSVIKRDSAVNRTDDYDLILTIMAGNSQIEHLKINDDNDSQSVQIGINRMDMFDVKLLKL